MKLIVWIATTAIVLLVLLLGLQMLASESGEVVVVTTTEAGELRQTRVWIVDDGETSWLRAGSDRQGWYARVREDAHVRVRRDGVTVAYVATPVPAATSAVNRLMAAKYGWADRFIGLMFPRERAIAIRLDPVEPPQPPSAASMSA